MQGTKPVDNYMTQFEEYKMWFNVVENKIVILCKFSWDLNNDFRKELVHREVTPLNQAYTLV